MKPVPGWRKAGRPPADIDGQEKTSHWPRFMVSMRPATRVKLDALSAVERKSPWKVIEDALDAYASQLPAERRRLVDALSRIAHEH